MRAIKISLIFTGIIFILSSLYISTLIYPYYTVGNSHFIAEFKNIDYNIYEFPEYSYIKFPTWTFTNTSENTTMVLSDDLQSKINYAGSLSSGDSWYYFAFSKEPIEDGLYAVSEINFHTLESLKGTRAYLGEIINFSKADQTFLIKQKIYKVISILFFIIGISIISLYLLTNNLNSKANLLAQQGKFDDAIRLARKTLEIDPEDLTALIGIGNIFSLMGKFDDAKIYYDKAIKLYPKLAWVRHTIGLNYFYEKKDYDESIKYFEKAIELNPNYSQVHYDIACVFSLKNDVDRAIQSLQKAIELSKMYYISRAKVDKDFDNIRDKIEFINLIKYIN